MILKNIRQADIKHKNSILLFYINFSRNLLRIEPQLKKKYHNLKI